jgi:SAM-dependent methyltransferase
MPELPRFNDNPSNDKNTPLTEADVDRTSFQPVVLRLLERTAARMGKPKGSLRVLDYGCGRGEKTAYLRRLGYDGYGVEIEPSYLEKARHYFGTPQSGLPIVSLLDERGRTVFPDGYFDVILTDQVLEHVEDLDAVLAELNRVTQPDGVMLHVFPSAFSVIEPHMFLPAVHWLPKNGLRRACIGLMLRLGMGARYFTDLPARDRATVFFEFSKNYTFYRKPHLLSGVFAAHGFCLRRVQREKLMSRGGFTARVVQLPMVGALAAGLYGAFYQTYLLAAKTPRALQI